RLGGVLAAVPDEAAGDPEGLREGPLALRGVGVPLTRTAAGRVRPLDVRPVRRPPRRPVSAHSTWSSAWSSAWPAPGPMPRPMPGPILYGRRDAMGRTLRTVMTVAYRPRPSVVRRDSGLYGYERALARRGLSPIAGVDEAGRGACAGPLVVAAVVLGREIEGRTDAKLST